MLEAASIVGREFAAPLLAAACDREEDDVEVSCEALAAHGPIERRVAEAWPDGTVASRYAFVHDLYPEMLYLRIPAGRRARLHRRVGDRLAAAFGGQAETVAAEVALHFVEARMLTVRSGSSVSAAAQAARRGGHQESGRHLAAALDALRTAPPDGDPGQAGDRASRGVR